MGGQNYDQVGDGGLFGDMIELTNGNYVVNSPYWNNSSVEGGAVTWCSGTIGCLGPIKADNSVVGTQNGDGLGYYPVIALVNGNFVIYSTSWNNGAVVHAGAARWCNGTSGCVGPMTPTNSLVGTHNNDGVGQTSDLTNSNYVVRSARWDNECHP